MSQTDDKLQFIHFWRFEVMSTFSMRDSDSFSTIHGPRIYEWCIRIDRGDNFGFRGLENRGVELSVEPTIRSFNTRLPQNSTCTFDIRVIEPLTSKVLLKAGPHTCPVVDDPHGNRGFFLPQTSDMGVVVQKMLKGNEYFGNRCELTSILSIPTASFDVDKIENVAPRPPAVPDFRFRMLTDKSRQDFTIRCRDGDILIAKEGIFLASEYFRDYLEAADHNDANFGDVNKQAVQIALHFTLTGTMVPPQSISSSLVNDVIETARRLRSLNFPKLRNALEEEAVKAAVKDHESLEDLLSWFICSHDCGMPILHMVCLAYIASIHANQYMRDFTEGSMVISVARAHPELAEKLNRRQGILRPTPHVG
ncbi:hypothetical protein Y032_0120g941 [Ancylostoma ceylanicum]|uniref:BTB domain-containing protein n=1 Tax=Ancylostoma ceylanicum TaxID=53326 RepID=A0A016TAY0_9BILA|nr:hypothetical protein Y032_0120g941 [Ancylostoma ceylanicum]